MYEVNFGKKSVPNNETQESASIQDAIKMIESGDTEQALETLKGMATAQAKEEGEMNKEEVQEAPKKDLASIIASKVK